MRIPKKNVKHGGKGKMTGAEPASVSPATKSDRGKGHSKVGRPLRFGWEEKRPNRGGKRGPTIVISQGSTPRQKGGGEAGPK